MYINTFFGSPIHMYVMQVRFPKSPTPNTAPHIDMPVQSHIGWNPVTKMSSVLEIHHFKKSCCTASTDA